jgi:hypothetical protein
VIFRINPMESNEIDLTFLKRHGCNEQCTKGCAFCLRKANEKIISENTKLKQELLELINIKTNTDT